MIYAVGDLQGCLDELLQLLEQVGFTDSDQLWLTGDLVNRGPKSLETLRFIKSLGAQACTVLGNHDLHLLAVAHDKKSVGRKDTFDEILAAPDRLELMEWLRHLPLLHHDQGYMMVHAGIPPIWDPDTAAACAAEMEEVLQGPNAAEFFANMYGNSPERWDPSLEGHARHRLITNYLTRMRFCSADGTLELATKTGPTNPPEGFAPWFSFDNHRCADQQLLFGHWASLEGRAGRDGFHALDTGCVWGGQLTALRLQDQCLFQVASPGYA
ncbi:symmetrical bis(5'-nucleosyl)-tetraphosphatase [Motiliproteus coralliicola]|uniref:Bis(5'-nucleosyl)-tetraphosphatase, symmetrical n=1 Tax=Motiliproteus coralliicola TaxID=2283196 RepID=A0A369WCW2_9GAMM|nr:symmetrical bis(5'-nucleosyl)-tetraphosphatase [Motiliproteus coralliicola]RDE19870.1 symmetrical bis(5'-nucleosyl)-tetraphosphatase [Motiliproteus coralliicola]